MGRSNIRKPGGILNPGAVESISRLTDASIGFEDGFGAGGKALAAMILSRTEYARNL